ncbi:hypothetical protein PR048_004879 [Dryococelus australis]|uniref:Uncharacterized protein n=1 Tax=Dryococelus australis TaxID=614101 RepID=A0ABQ9I7P7_9NEOP|nr:hypothetical protein PR048_004879 [Dryococelus australis]
MVSAVIQGPSHKGCPGFGRITSRRSVTALLCGLFRFRGGNVVSWPNRPDQRTTQPRRTGPGRPLPRNSLPPSTPTEILLLQYFDPTKPPKLNYIRFRLADSGFGGLSVSVVRIGTVVSEWLDFSPPTKANRFQSLAGSLPDFRKWVFFRTMPLVAGFSWETPLYFAPAFRRCSILTSFHPDRLSIPRC